IWPNSVRLAGHRGRTTSTMGSRHARPNVNRNERKVNGAAYCKPILVATKPEPQTVTKYHASNVSSQRRSAPDGSEAAPVTPGVRGQAGSQASGASLASKLNSTR